MGAIKKFITPQILVGVIGVIALVTIGVVFVVTSSSPRLAYSAVSQGPITEEVDTTGTVKAAEEVDLSFQRAGQIASVHAPVGSTVAAGTLLASLSASDASAALEQAEASLAVEQAKLDSLNAGTRPEDVAVSETAVTGAKSALAQAKVVVVQAVADAYIKSDDAIHNKIDQFMQNPRGAAPKLMVPLSDSQTEIDIESGRVGIEAILSSWQKSVTAASSATDPDISSITAEAKINLAKIGAYLDTVALGFSTLTPSASLSAATVQSDQASVAAGRSEISASASAVINATIAETAAENALASAKSSLALKQAGTTPADIEAQVAQVAAAEASVHAAQAELGKTVIRAPITGVITKNDAHIGATASPGAVLISMNSAAKFQIEAKVSEADLGKIAVGNDVRVFLDAYPNGAAFPAKVIAIDPAATIENGIASYKVTAEFTTDDPDVKAGLTGNLHIITATKDDVLMVPTSALITKGDSIYVLRKGPKQDELVEVQVGIAGENGSTEIQSGLSEGDQVRSFGSSE
jgi:RND family efflux transporter MFP subunit